MERSFASERRPLWHLCYRMTGSAADAEDLVQDTFARALQQPPPSLEEPLRPWLFRVAARQVEVYADRSRRCPVADPDDRELFIGLGAAVFGVRLAMSRLRVRPVVGLCHDATRPDLAAVVVTAGHMHAPDEDDELYDQLDRRRTTWTASSRSGTSTWICAPQMCCSLTSTWYSCCIWANRLPAEMSPPSPRSGRR